MICRPLLHACGLAVAATLALASPGAPPRAAAASCSGWTSETTPPPTIRVFRSASGAVETVDFRAYTKNVLSREWISSWTTESLRSGAIAVKSYAWYHVLHWRGYTNADGECFDVFDSTRDQVYDPARPTYASAAVAVDATWGTRALKNGRIFPTYYNAGSIGEACGANANGWRMYQWGTQACGLAGRTAAEIILIYYYPGVTVADAPPGTTPSPTPTPSPTATPSPTPTSTPTLSPDSSPGAATPSPTPDATPMPTAVPTPAPTQAPTAAPTAPPASATPPSVAAQPGGGQVDLADAPAPPPPPPARPQPVAVAAVAAPEATAAPQGEASSPSAWHRFAESPSGQHVAASPVGHQPTDARLLLWRALARSAIDDLLAALARAAQARAPDPPQVVALLLRLVA